jgi:hypothetical protein
MTSINETSHRKKRRKQNINANSGSSAQDETSISSKNVDLKQSEYEIPTYKQPYEKLDQPHTASNATADHNYNIVPIPVREVPPTKKLSWTKPAWPVKGTIFENLNDRKLLLDHCYYAKGRKYEAYVEKGGGWNKAVTRCSNKRCGGMLWCVSTATQQHEAKNRAYRVLESTDCICLPKSVQIDTMPTRLKLMATEYNTFESVMQIAVLIVYNAHFFAKPFTFHTKDSTTQTTPLSCGCSAGCKGSIVIKASPVRKMTGKRVLRNWGAPWMVTEAIPCPGVGFTVSPSGKRLT